MNKTRLEALSDGVFSIVMTLLVIEIVVPSLRTPDDYALWQALMTLKPLFVSYFMSFVVLAMFWISHTAFYSVFTRVINRQLALLNIIYLSFIALIPFSSHLIGEYPHSAVAMLFYGFNVLLISLVSITVLRYAITSHEIDTSHVSRRIIIQAQIRNFLVPCATLTGMALTGVSLSVAMVCYGLPIIFNIIPGTLDFIERRLGLNFE